MVTGNLEVTDHKLGKIMLRPGALSAEFCAFLQDLAKNENIGASGAGADEFCLMIWGFRLAFEM